MKLLLAVFMTLAVTSAACLSGCESSLAPVSPPYESTTSATPSPVSGDQSGNTDTPTPSPQGAGEGLTPTPAQGTPEAPLPHGARRAVELAKADLARRSGTSVSEISVISLEAVDWPDTSLGCPQPDMAYAQVISPGYLIVLEAKGQTYEYHSDEDSSVVLCRGDE